MADDVRTYYNEGRQPQIRTPESTGNCVPVHADNIVVSYN
jgi:hypothetical protein